MPPQSISRGNMGLPLFKNKVQQVLRFLGDVSIMNIFLLSWERPLIINNLVIKKFDSKNSVSDNFLTHFQPINTPFLHPLKTFWGGIEMKHWLKMCYKTF